MRVLIGAAMAVLTAIGSSVAAERPHDWSLEVLLGGYPGVALRGEYWDPRLPVEPRRRQIAVRWYDHIDDHFSRCPITSAPMGRYWEGVAVFVRPKSDPVVGQGMARFIELAGLAGDTVLRLRGADPEYLVVAAGIPPEGVILILKCAFGGYGGRWSPGEESVVRYATTVLGLSP